MLADALARLEHVNTALHTVMRRRGVPASTGHLRVYGACNADVLCGRDGRGGAVWAGMQGGMDVGEGQTEGDRLGGGRWSWRREGVLAAGGGRRLGGREVYPIREAHCLRCLGSVLALVSGRRWRSARRAERGGGKGVVVEDDGAPLEFTFPSLSDALGNAYYRARPSHSRSRSASPVRAPSPPAAATDVVVEESAGAPLPASVSDPGALAPLDADTPALPTALSADAALLHVAQ